MAALEFAKRNRNRGRARRKGRRDLLRTAMRPRSTVPVMREKVIEEVKSLRRSE